MLEIELITDFRRLIRNKSDDVYQEGEFTINDTPYPIRLRAKENYHREAYGFPPIILNISKTEFED